MKKEDCSASPSIGSIGVTVDHLNNRVKVLSGEVYLSISVIIEYLISSVSNNRDALQLLSSFSYRFTSRVIGKNIGVINPFVLLSGVVVKEEARIKTKSGLHVIYLGSNGVDRMNTDQYNQELNLSRNSSKAIVAFPEPTDITFERLKLPTDSDIEQLLEMYQLCFLEYLVPINSDLVLNATKGAIFYVARNFSGRIIASAIGESLNVGPLTFVEISEVATNPNYRVKGAASGCAKRVVEVSNQIFGESLVVFWEARMWRNVLGISSMVGLNNFAGVLHQHCRISSPKEFTSIDQTDFGSLAVFYG